MSEFAIRTSRLTKRFGKEVAVSNLDLDVPPGTIYGYLGPNGAGKTTTMKMLVGLYHPTAGQAVVLGLDVARHTDAVQARIGYLPGDFRGYGDHTAQRFLRLLGSLRGGVDWSYVEALADRFGLDLGRRLGTLSHGNRQKVGIIQAVMHRPELLILDEPTNGLDPLMQREFLALLSESRAGGSTVLLSSHVLAEVAAVADHVAMLDRGRLIAVRSMSQLQCDSVRKLELTFVAEVPLPALAHVPNVREVHVAGRTVHMTVAGSLEELMRTAAPYGIADVETHETDLTDVFLGYYDKEGDDGEHLLQSDLGPAAQSLGVG